MNNPGEMLSNAAVCKMADDLMRQYGKDAVIVAALRAGEMLNAGDVDGYRTWKRLIMLVDGVDVEDQPGAVNLH
ncbi:MAG: hypothetical protein ACTSV1_09165 [Alphaproteobacteria bacterium]